MRVLALVFLPNTAKQPRATNACNYWHFSDVWTCGVAAKRDPAREEGIRRWDSRSDTSSPPGRARGERPESCLSAFMTRVCSRLFQSSRRFCTWHFLDYSRTPWGHTSRSSDAISTIETSPLLLLLVALINIPKWWCARKLGRRTRYV